MQSKTKTQDFRCTNCNRLLAKVTYGNMEIKCPRCKTINSKKIVTAS